MGKKRDAEEADTVRYDSRCGILREGGGGAEVWIRKKKEAGPVAGPASENCPDFLEPKAFYRLGWRGQRTGRSPSGSLTAGGLFFDFAGELGGEGNLGPDLGGGGQADGRGAEDRAVPLHVVLRNNENGGGFVGRWQGVFWNEERHVLQGG